jgi:hypothetical protein
VTQSHAETPPFMENFVQMVLRGAGIQGTVPSKQVLGSGCRHAYSCAAIKRLARRDAVAQCLRASFDRKQPGCRRAVG